MSLSAGGWVSEAERQREKYGEGGRGEDRATPMCKNEKLRLDHRSGKQGVEPGKKQKRRMDGLRHWKVAMLCSGFQCSLVVGTTYYVAR